ncbi:MAG: T9SS type A sorting domain-containing protein [Chryseobacterium sp.]|nr:T9SS type A sorting domain-containing protein [Chryseobacterium sp.]
MKKNYFLLLFSCSQLFFSQIINFTDANFKARLLESSSTNYIAADLSGNATKIDQNNDGEIDISEALNISKISISGNASPVSYIQNYYFSSYNIASLEGVNNFKNLKILECKNNNLTSLDFKDLVNLEQIYCQNNQITEFLNFNDINKLYIIRCNDNLLTNLDFSQSARNIDFYSQYYDNRGSVMYSYYNNPLINLNLQTGTQTIWMILSEWGSCAFGNLFSIAFNTCGNEPGPIPTLVNLKVNCFEVDNYQQYLSRNNMDVNLVDNCLIATDETSKIRLTTYPNPAQDFLKLDTEEKIQKIDIYDVSGRIVFSPSINQNKINISKLKSGVYYLNLSINGKSLKTKFIKE